MRRHFYVAPTSTVAATPPQAAHHALTCPGLPAWSIVVVEDWPDVASEDAWENLPNVTEHYPENLGAQAPASVITAFAPWGAASGMTVREVFRLIRARWKPWWT